MYITQFKQGNTAYLKVKQHYFKIVSINYGGSGKTTVMVEEDDKMRVVGNKTRIYPLNELPNLMYTNGVEVIDIRSYSADLENTRKGKFLDSMIQRVKRSNKRELWQLYVAGYHDFDYAQLPALKRRYGQLTLIMKSHVQEVYGFKRIPPKTKNS